MTKCKPYCCVLFEESVKEKKFLHAKGCDETEWHIPEWHHIYYCPFCGTNVKGKGFGTYDKDHSRGCTRSDSSMDKQ